MKEFKGGKLENKYTKKKQQLPYTTAIINQEIIKKDIICITKN